MNIICDIDGTVACGKHREHFVNCKPKNWKAYYNLVSSDSPIKPVLELLAALYRNGSSIYFVSGRGSDVRTETLAWLNNYCSFEVTEPMLKMRVAKDYRPDFIIKKEILDSLIKEGFTPDLVIDDRNSVVKMWRDNGLLCLQPREGDF